MKHTFDSVLLSKIRKFKRKDCVFYIIRPDDNNEKDYLEIIYLTNNESIVLRKSVIKIKDFKERLIEKINLILTSKIGNKNGYIISNILKNDFDFNKFMFSEVLDINDIRLFRKGLFNNDFIDYELDIIVDIEMKLTDYFELNMKIFDSNNKELVGVLNEKL